MTGRVALVLTTSTLHHREGATPGAVLERQRRLLAATGHDRVVLLGGGITGGEGTAAEAAALLKGAERVTVLGHAVLVTEAALARTVAADAVATRPDEAGWERIDSTDGWAGVMRCPGELVRATLAELGEWDAQATLVRRAAQAGLPRLALGPGSTAHAFAPAECDALLAGERMGRLEGAPAALTRRGQAVADRLAGWLDRLTPRAPTAAALLTAVVCLTLLGCALVGWTGAAALLLPPVALSAGVAASAARLDRRAPWPGPAIALAVLALAPPLLARSEVRDGAVMPVAWASALLAAALLVEQGRWSGRWLRLDTVALALAGGLLVAGPGPTMVFAAPTLLTAGLLLPPARRRLAAIWRRWQD